MKQVKIVVFVPITHTDQVKKVHPYEEVAFDIYPLLSEEEL